MTIPEIPPYPAPIWWIPAIMGGFLLAGLLLGVWLTRWEDSDK